MRVHESFVVKSLFFALLTLPMFGCGKSVIVKNGIPVSQQDFNKAQSKCSEEANIKYPPNLTQVHQQPVQINQNLNNNTTTNSTTVCNRGAFNSVECQTRAKTYTPPPAPPVYFANPFTPAVSVIDTNLEIRAYYINQCLTSQGFQEKFMSKKELESMGYK